MSEGPNGQFCYFVCRIHKWHLKSTVLSNVMWYLDRQIKSTVSKTLFSGSTNFTDETCVLTIAVHCLVLLRTETNVEPFKQTHKPTL
jgi:hypothetical protein